MNRHVVIRSIERADAAFIDELGAAGTATVHEGIGRRGYAGPHIVARQRGVKIAGSAVTVSSHPGDNGMIHAAVSVCRPGDIVVVSHTAPSTHGGFGDLLATSLMAHEVRAFVTDAAVRDTADLNAMGFPVWSQYVSCQGAVKATPGSVNVPIRFGEAIVAPGDIVCCDDDGVVVVPRAEAAWAAAQARERLDKEAGTRARLEAKQLGLDMYGLRDAQIAMGVEYLDTWSQ